MERFLSFLISLITVFGITLRPEDTGWALQASRSVFFLPLFVLTVYGIHVILVSDEKRLKIWALLPAAILSLCHVFGAVLEKKETALWILKEGNLIPGLACWAARTVLFYCLIFHLFRFLSKREDNGSAAFPKRSFFLFWIVLIAAWLPYYLNQFPAVITADTIDQIEMALGEEPLTDHHPVFYTWMIRIVLRTAERMFADPDLSHQAGTAIFTAVQLLLMTAVCAAVLTLIFRVSRSVILKWAATVFFLFYPVHPLYSVTMWKDVPFAVCLLAFLALLFCEQRQHKLRRCIGIALIGILISLFRHNGICVLLLSIPFILSSFRSGRKTVFCSFLAAVLFITGWKFILLPALQIPAGESSEALSIPLQQIALTAKRHHDTMDEGLLSGIGSFFSTPEIWKQYTPRIADPVKNRFSETYYRTHRGEFRKLWLKMGCSYPQDFIDGFLLHTYGYWYPEMQHWVFVTGIDNDGTFGIHSAPLLSGRIMGSAVQWLADSGYDRVPLLSLLFSPGACFWICLIGFCYCLYRRSPSYFLYIPVFILWLTALASPVNCEYRYVFGMFLCLPVLAAASLAAERPVPHTGEQEIM